MLVSLATNSEIDEKELKIFISSHPSLKIIDPSFTHQYDDEGNFKLLDLHKAGPPVSTEYLDWYLQQANDEVEKAEVVTEQEFSNWYFETKNQLVATETKSNS
jgi:hypothetical protein